MSLGSYFEFLAAQQERRDEEAKRDQFLAKSADALVKAGQSGDSNAVLSRLNMTDQEWGNLGARDKAATIAALVQSEALKQQDALNRAVSQAGTQTVPGTTTATAGAPTMFPPVTANVPLTVDRLSAAIAANPQAAGNPAADALLRAIQLHEQRKASVFFQPGQTNFDLPNVPGFKRIPTGPNTSQLIYSPENPGAAVPIIGPDGEQLGFGLQGRAGVTPVRTEKPTSKDQFNALERLHREYIRNAGLYPGTKVGDAWQQKADDVAAEMSRIMGQPTAPESTAAAGEAQTAGTGVATPVSAAAASAYKSADDVKAALAAGKINRAQALDALKTQFGFK